MKYAKAVNKLLIDQLKLKKHNYIQLATREGVLAKPEVQSRIKQLNQIIKSLGGDPTDE